MNIIVCVKEVPNPALPIEFDVEKNTVRDAEWNYILNPCDETAIEEALRLKAQFDGTVTALTIGPVRTEEILRKCLAMGADAAVRVEYARPADWDSYTTAQVLAGAIQKIPCDMVLCGSRSTDRSGETGIILAEVLKLPLVTGIVGLSITDDARTATATCRLERGARAVKSCRLPALFTVDLMLNEPRYPTLPGIKKAASQEIRQFNPETLVPDSGLLTPEGQTVRTIAINRPPPKKIFIPSGNLSPMDRLKMLTQGNAAKKSSGKFLEGNPEDIAQKTVDFLKERKLIG